MNDRAPGGRAPGGRAPCGAAADDAAAYARIEALLDAAGAPHPRHIAGRADGGTGHDTWKVDAGGRRLAVRLALPAPRYAAALAVEARVLPAVSAAGVAPRLLHYDDRDGSAVSLWHAGRAWRVADLEHSVRRARLAGLLRRLHAVSLEVPAFDLLAAVAGYERALRGAAAAEPNLRTRLADLEALAQRFVRRRRLDGLGHNDLVVENVVGYTSPRLLDWEYAAPNDRLFDVATITALHPLPAAARASFLTCMRLLPDERERLAETERLVRLLAWVWARAERQRRPQDPRPVAWQRRLEARLPPV